MGRFLLVVFCVCQHPHLAIVGGCPVRIDPLRGDKAGVSHLARYPSQRFAGGDHHRGICVPGLVLGAGLHAAGSTLRW